MEINPPATPVPPTPHPAHTDTHTHPLSLLSLILSSQDTLLNVMNASYTMILALSVCWVALVGSILGYCKSLVVLTADCCHNTANAIVGSSAEGSQFTIHDSQQMHFGSARTTAKFRFTHDSQSRFLIMLRFLLAQTSFNMWNLAAGLEGLLTICHLNRHLAISTYTQGP